MRSGPARKCFSQALTRIQLSGVSEQGRGRPAMKRFLKVGLVIAATIGFTAFTVHANGGQTVSSIAITEPASLLLLGTGLAGVAGIFRRRLRSRQSK